MTKIRKLEHHGRETYAVYYGDDFVLKRPLPSFGQEAMDKWLEKQHRTKENIDRIRAVGNPIYNVPAMRFINDEEYQILEERAPGIPLTRSVYRALTRRQKFEIINSIAGFLVDMNECQPVGDTVRHKISDDFKFARFDNFVNNKMTNWFTKNEIYQMARLRNKIGDFEYDTRMAWSHGDLNSGNVLYDPKTSKLSFIDFAEAGYQFIYRDIFAPLQIELDIYKQVYDIYTKMHNKSLFRIPSSKNDALREIMKYRIIVTMLKRFVKAADDLRMNPDSAKGENNNIAKVQFMREQMAQIAKIEFEFSK